MNIQWFSKNLNGVVTLYETNITLNTVASSYFTNTYATLIGYSKEEQCLIIKSLNKRDVEEGNYKEQDLHPISIKPSYGRINGKSIISNLTKFYPLDFSTKKMYKFNCEWNEVKKYLKVHLDKEVL